MDRRERFESFVWPDPINGCWWWTGYIDPGPKDGYGRFQTGFGKNKTTEKAHRVAWELLVGPIPKGLCVLHRCDNRACVNPSHLFLGTHQDNVDDMIAKGRRVPTPTGELNSNTVISTASIQRLKNERAKGKSQQALATMFHISQTHVSRILRGECRVDG